MSFIASILFLAASVFFIIGMIAPKKLSMPRKKSGAIAFGLMAASMVIMPKTVSLTAEEQAAKSQEKKADEAKAAANKERDNLAKNRVETLTPPEPTKKSGTLLDKIVDNQMDKITDKVGRDSVTKYEIALRNGGRMDICVAAMGVSAAWLQAKNESEYANAKAVEKQKCKAAGL